MIDIRPFRRGNLDFDMHFDLQELVVHSWVALVVELFGLDMGLRNRVDWMRVVRVNGEEVEMVVRALVAHKGHLEQDYLQLLFWLLERRDRCA